MFIFLVLNKVALFGHHHQTDIFIGSWLKSQCYTNVIRTSSCCLSATFRKALESETALSDLTL